MKQSRYSVLRSSTAALFGLGALFTFPVSAQTKPATPEKQETFRVKMVKVIDGKTTIMDTTFTSTEHAKIRELLKTLKLPDSTLFSERLKPGIWQREELKVLSPESFSFRYKTAAASINVDSTQLIFLRKGSIPDSIRVKLHKLPAEKHLRMFVNDSVFTSGLRPDETDRGAQVKIYRMLPDDIYKEEIVTESEGTRELGKPFRIRVFRKLVVQDLDEKDKARLKKQAKAPGAGKNELQLKNLRYYPNPSNGIFNLSFTSGKCSDLRITIYDVTGREIYSEKAQQFTGQYDNKIDLSGLGKGIYFLKITQGKQAITKKLLVE